MRLRPYEAADAETIVSWLRDERAQRLWSADRYGAYPVTAADMNEKYLGNHGDCPGPGWFHPLTAEEDGQIVGHLILRYTDPEKTTVRFGFVIVDDARRGRGLGKEMLRLAEKYAFDTLGADRLTLGVFDVNPAAYHCYRAAGFRETPGAKKTDFPVLGETWYCIEMELLRSGDT